VIWLNAPCKSALSGAKKGSMKENGQEMRGQGGGKRGGHTETVANP